MTTSSTVDLRSEMKALLDGQSGGVLATVGPDGQPHLVFVLIAATEALEVLFASDPGRGHAHQLHANPRVAFLADTRDQIAASPTLFQRLEVHGTAEVVPVDHPDYAVVEAALLAKHRMVRAFLDKGCHIYRVRPDVLTLSRGGSDKSQYRPTADGQDQE